VAVTLFFYTLFVFFPANKTKWGPGWEQSRQDRRDRPGGYLNRWYTTGNSREKPLFSTSLQSTHKGVTRPFRILSAWYQELKDRCLEVIKLPGFGGTWWRVLLHNCMGRRWTYLMRRPWCTNQVNGGRFGLICCISSTGAWHPPPPRLRLILCLVNLRNKLLCFEICRFPCVPTVNIHNARSAHLAQWYTLPPRPTRNCGSVY
jgi:hypothetical protein